MTACSIALAILTITVEEHAQEVGDAARRAVRFFSKTLRNAVALRTYFFVTLLIDITNLALNVVRQCHCQHRRQHKQPTHPCPKSAIRNSTINVELESRIVNRESYNVQSIVSCDIIIIGKAFVFLLGCPLQSRRSG